MTKRYRSMTRNLGSALKKRKPHLLPISLSCSFESDKTSIS